MILSYNMRKVYRQDAIKCDRVTIDGAGILRARVRIGRVGIQNYIVDGTIVRELRAFDDVKDSANTFAQQVVTLDHPPEMVDSNNAYKYAKGLTGDRVDLVDGFLETNITITHKDAVDAAKSTHRQFSNGYWAELVDEAGVWTDRWGVMGNPGKQYEYDRIQKQIEGNHVALVKQARAGSKATFFDSLEKSSTFTIDCHHTNDCKNMVQIIHNDSVLTIDGDDAESVKAILQQYKTDLAKEKNDSLDTISKLESEKDTLWATNASLQGKVDGLEATDNTRLDEDAIAAETEARIATWNQVIPHLDSDFIPDYKLDSIAIKRLWLITALPDLKTKIDNGGDAYIDALWDVKQPSVKSTKTDSVKEAFKSGNAVPKLDTIDKARQAYIDARTRK